MIERIVRVAAGTLFLTSITLAYTFNTNWLWLGVFVGINLLQSAFTGFCPLEKILKILGVNNQ